ncbi:hypothetical protein [Algibacter sp. L3A6]|uniref:hypothetical protein n=1 Tax=Algibacter sp. L3A6 TaxID=2686366 RepID=UPI00131AFABA|nr:hypothetical protein [Algibacter sp. L3A6]
MKQAFFHAIKSRLFEYHSNRINELIDAKIDAKSYFSDARLNNKKVIIESTVTIRIED